MVMDELTKVALYLPDDMTFDLKLRVLNERTKLTEFISRKLRDVVNEPTKLKEVKMPKYVQGTGRIRMTTDVPRDIC
jgi:hypothetical protein